MSHGLDRDLYELRSLLERLDKLQNKRNVLNEQSWSMGTPVMTDATWAAQYPTPGIRLGSYRGRPDTIQANINSWSFRHANMNRNSIISGMPIEITSIKIEHYKSYNGIIDIHFSYKFKGYNNEGGSEMGRYTIVGKTNKPILHIRDYGDHTLNNRITSILTQELTKMLTPIRGKSYAAEATVPIYHQSTGELKYLTIGDVITIVDIDKNYSKLIVKMKDDFDYYFTNANTYYLFNILFSDANLMIKPIKN
jgi:hypothetical protein